jgi:hypothetical protein
MPFMQRKSVKINIFQAIYRPIRFTPISLLLLGDYFRRHTGIKREYSDYLQRLARGQHEQWLIEQLRHEHELLVEQFQQ